jgi:hypothetical protein
VGRAHGLLGLAGGVVDEGGRHQQHRVVGCRGAHQRLELLLHVGSQRSAAQQPHRLQRRVRRVRGDLVHNNLRPVLQDEGPVHKHVALHPLRLLVHCQALALADASLQVARVQQRRQLLHLTLPATPDHVSKKNNT